MCKETVLVKAAAKDNPSRSPKTQEAQVLLVFCLKQIYQYTLSIRIDFFVYLSELEISIPQLNKKYVLHTCCQCLIFSCSIKFVLHLCVGLVWKCQGTTGKCLWNSTKLLSLNWDLLVFQRSCYWLLFLWVFSLSHPLYLELCLHLRINCVQVLNIASGGMAAFIIQIPKVEGNVMHFNDIKTVFVLNSLSLYLLFCFAIS